MVYHQPDHQLGTNWTSTWCGKIDLKVVSEEVHKALREAHTLVFFTLLSQFQVNLCGYKLPGSFGFGGRIHWAG